MNKNTAIRKFLEISKPDSIVSLDIYSDFTNYKGEVITNEKEWFLFIFKDLEKSLSDNVSITRQTSYLLNKIKEEFQLFPVGNGDQAIFFAILISKIIDYKIKNNYRGNINLLTDILMYINSFSWTTMQTLIFRIIAVYGEDYIPFLSKKDTINNYYKNITSSFILADRNVPFISNDANWYTKTIREFALNENVKNLISSRTNIRKDDIENIFKNVSYVVFDDEVQHIVKSTLDELIRINKKDSSWF